MFGSIQMPLFEENFLLRQGHKEVRIWPFEEYDPRMVCQGECFNKPKPNDQYNPNVIQKGMQLQIEF